MKRPRFKYYIDQMLDKPEPMFGLIRGGGMPDVCGEELLKVGKPLPLFPDYKTWSREVTAKRRCGRCWAVTRGFNDLVRHTQTNHLSVLIHMPAKEQ